MSLIKRLNIDQLKGLAAEFIQNLHAPAVVYMEGDLGAGKTTFVRAALQELLGENEHIPSPTFTLVQTYETSKGSVWHYDLYRLQDPEEVLELDMEEAFNTGIVFIEWAERMNNVFNPPHYTVKLAHDNGDDSVRSISIAEP